jgi:hypothetical protein
MALGGGSAQAGIGADLAGAAAKGMGYGATSSVAGSAVYKKQNAEDMAFADKIPDEWDRTRYMKAVKSIIRSRDDSVMRYAGHDGSASRGSITVAERQFNRIKTELSQKYNIPMDPVKEQGVAEGLSLDEQFDIIEEMVEALAEQHGVDSEMIWEDFESVDDNELYETAAWRRKEGKSKKGGLNAKGVASYRRENPGSKLQTAVTTKPSKLKPGSKAAKRRKSFCARMSGVKGPMKKPNGKPTRKALALRKWNC